MTGRTASAPRPGRARGFRRIDGRARAAALVLAAALCFAGCTQPRAAPPDGGARDAGVDGGKKEVFVDAGALKQRILAKDWEAVEEASKIGPGGAPSLTDVIASPDPEVRRLAFTALGEMGGEPAAALLVKGIEDEDLNVRTMAMAGLDRCATPAVKAPLEAILPRSEDEVIRSRVALLLGRIGDDATSAALAAREKVESDPEAAASVRLALARLGDRKKRDEVIAELGSTTARARYAALKKIAYIADPRLLHHLLPLAADAAGAQNIAPSHAPPLMMRIMDVVVTVTAEVTRHRFSFDATQKRLYTGPEIAEVKAHIASLPAPSP